MSDVPEHSPSSADAEGRRAALVSFLATRDEACPSCGYNLRGLASERCPECNQALRLHVGLAEQRLAWFVVGLVGLATGAGFSGLLLMYAFIKLRKPDSGMFGKFLLVTGIGLFVEGGLLLFWVFARKSLGRRGVMIRWVLAALWCLLTLANLIVFASVIR